MTSTLDRRAPHRGDRRRGALLESLDRHLRDGSLEDIHVADISRGAGVTRSAFYFYFENKAAAVAALMSEVYAEVTAVTAVLTGPGEPADRVRTTIGNLVDAFDRHRHVYSAMLAARATSPTVQQLWDEDRQSFVAPVAAMIEAERAAGRAPAGVDATALAAMLLELNDRLLERVARGGPVDRALLVEATVAIWLGAVYGRSGR